MRTTFCGRNAHVHGSNAENVIPLKMRNHLDYGCQRMGGDSHSSKRSFILYLRRGGPDRLVSWLEQSFYRRKLLVRMLITK